MPWIESHAGLVDHPKTVKAAHLLGIEPVQLVGHLHVLWHWALTYAEFGDLSRFDAADIALAAKWPGAADEFAQALIDCGPGDSAGFLERNGVYGPPDDPRVGELVLHDWWDCAGKLVDRRWRDAQRKRDARARSNGHPDPDPSTSNGRHDPEPSPSAGRPQDVPETPARTADEHPDTDPRARTNTTNTTNTTTREPSGSRSSPDDDFSDEVCALTRHLGQRVKANGHKTPDPATKAAYNWFDAIDKLLRLDGADASEVHEVIEWATADEFWRANIRSAAKFRDQYSQLRLQRQRQPQANGSHRGRDPPRPAGHEPNLSDEPVTAKRVQP
jgi:hypothetical protein